MILPPTERFQVPIPRAFHSFELGGPFDKCMVCGRDILKDGTTYFIEKAYRSGEVVFEYAICDSCRGDANEMISFESMSNIGIYLMEHSDALARRSALLNSFDNSVVPWLDSCFFTGTERSECPDFQICAECLGDQLVVSLLPMLISQEAGETFQSLMSKQTRDNFDGFTRETLNPPVDYHAPPLLI